MEKLVSAKVQRIEDSRKVSSKKGKKKLAIVFGNGASQVHDTKMDPPQPELLDLILLEKALTL
jgi:hypothetical protein